MSTPETIYLLLDDDGYVWCDDPAPGIEQDPADAIKYIRADQVEDLQAELLELKLKLLAAQEALERERNL